MTIEELLFNYGVAGAMLVYFIYERSTFQKSLRQVIDNNTIALTKFYEIVKDYEKKAL